MKYEKYPLTNKFDHGFLLLLISSINKKLKF